MARHQVILMSSAIILTVMLILITLFIQHHYMLASVLFVILTFLPFVIRFERRKISGRELVLLAVLSAIAAVSRVPFASIPSVQPTTFVIIITGLALGAESGFVVGALAALVSNLFLGQGPWTPWQMYSWGMIGLAAGLLRHTKFMKWSIGRYIFGFISGILFGWVMNIWIFMGNIEQITISHILASFGTSFYFDLAHAVSNVFFLAVFGKAWIKILLRFKKKYGLLDH
ncbi:ECF transporter S component [Heyndrickxia vini]|uniref:ECF transporter S component n=1 Tax=Heyndrickxia vini TaxID=1476025 RepID=A0ABX7DXD3_9BACI|nr:ECF transporter S component [Heyndrickxia vini]QQZ08148.1 ECF transporter S component [Heyndrickxia vini]